MAKTKNNVIGFLFRAHPTLMTQESSAEMMDAIFESSAIEGRARVLKIMQDFLISESSKAATQQKGQLLPHNPVLESRLRLYH